MAKVWLQSGLGGGVATTGTEWVALSNSSQLCSVGPTAAHDIGCQYTNRVPGVVSDLYARVVTNTWNSAGSYAFRLRYNDGASYGTGTITYLDLQTGEKTGVGAADTIADGDVLQYEWTRTGAGSGTITSSIISCVLTPTTGTAWHYGNGEKNSYSTASQSRYYNPIGASTSSTVEAVAEIKATVAQTLSNLSVQLFTNLRTTNTVYTARKNGADQTPTVTFGNLEFGIKEDTTNSFAVAVDDTWCYKHLTSTGTEAFEVTMLMMKAVSGTAGVVPFGTMATQVVSATVTEYAPAAGSMFFTTATEADVQGAVPFGFTMDKFRGFVRTGTNGITGNSTMNVRHKVGGVTSTVVTLTWTTGQTGEKLDASTSVTVNAGDSLNISLVAGAAGTTIEFNGFTARATQTATAVVSSTGMLLGV